MDIALLLLSGGIGAGAARLLRLPMWPITGSIAGSAGMQAVLSGTTALPSWCGVAGQILVGVSLGSAIDLAVLRQFRAMLAAGIIAVATLVATGLVGGAVIAATGLLRRTEAVLGTIPGGLGEMVAAATALGVDSAVVAGMHVARLLVVLLTIPLLVRWAARWRPRR